jgi:hypothetical protein
MTPERCCYCGEQIGPDGAAGHDGWGNPVCADCAAGAEPCSGLPAEWWAE